MPTGFTAHGEKRSAHGGADMDMWDIIGDVDDSEEEVRRLM